MSDINLMTIDEFYKHFVRAQEAGESNYDAMSYALKQANLRCLHRERQMLTDLGESLKSINDNIEEITR